MFEHTHERNSNLAMHLRRAFYASQVEQADQVLAHENITRATRRHWEKVQREAEQKLAELT